MDQYATWYGGRPQPRRHCVRWGPSSPPQKGAEPPNFRPMSIVANWLDGSRCHLVGELGLSSGHIVRRGPNYPSPAKGAQHPPVFSAHVYCGHGRPSQLLLSSCTNSRPKTVGPMLSYRCLSVCMSYLSCLSVTFMYCGQTVGWLMMKLGTEV